MTRTKFQGPKGSFTYNYVITKGEGGGFGMITVYPMPNLITEGGLTLVFFIDEISNMHLKFYIAIQLHRAGLKMGFWFVPAQLRTNSWCKSNPKHKLHLLWCWVRWFLIGLAWIMA